VSTSDRSGMPALRWLLLSVLVVVLDQWTKSLASAALTMHQSLPLFDGLQWTLAHNYGVAFSIFNDGEGWQRYGLSAFALTVASMFAWMLTRQPQQDRLSKLAFALVIGGAIGNALDRLRLGYVVDFIDVYWGQSHWPAFNIADSSICVGAVTLLIAGWHSGRSRAVTTPVER